MKTLIRLNRHTCRSESSLGPHESGWKCCALAQIIYFYKAGKHKAHSRGSEGLINQKTHLVAVEVAVAVLVKPKPPRPAAPVVAAVAVVVAAVVACVTVVDGGFAPNPKPGSPDEVVVVPDDAGVGKSEPVKGLLLFNCFHSIGKHSRRQTDIFLIFHKR